MLVVCNHVDIGVGKRVRALREARGLSQKQLAGVSCVSVSVIAAIEVGSTRVTADLLIVITQALSVPVAALFLDEFADFHSSSDASSSLSRLN
jgi:transcriptional regulator with XRE-family HTH domain